MATVQLTEKTNAVLNYLRGNTGKLTHQQIANGMGLDKAIQVVSSVNALYKQGFVDKTDSENGKLVQITSAGLDAVIELKQGGTGELSDKAKNIIGYLQKNPSVDFTAADIAENFGVQPIAINGVVNGLVKRGLAVREDYSQEVDGVEKTIKLIRLTPAGQAEVV